MGFMNLFKHFLGKDWGVHPADHKRPASDVPTLKRDAKLSVETIDTVYVFNMELDMRDKSPQVSAKDGSALPKNPLQDVRVREAIDIAINRPALAEIAMEGLGAAANQLGTPTIAGFNKELPAIKADTKRRIRREKKARVQRKEPRKLV